MVSKLLRNDLKYNTYTLRHYGIWNRGFGAVSIRAHQVGLAGTNVEMPVHLWDLRAVPQGNNSTSLHGYSTLLRSTN